MLVRVNGGNALDASPPPCKWQASCRHRSAFGVGHGHGREVALLRLERALGGERDRDRDRQQRCPGRPPPSAEKRALDRQPRPPARPQPRHAARPPLLPVDAMKLPDALGAGDRPPASACASAARGGACRNYLKRALADRRQPPSPSPSPSPHDDSDSSEELRYGPGIVNRLRTKYLSMTLRDNAKKGVRPSLSTLRKATSLDNLVDEQRLMDAEYGGASVVSCRVSEFEYGGGGGGCESRLLGDASAADLKRARSMETLQEDRSPKVARCYENGSPALADEQRREELPPPDVVKETLKIFENGRRSPLAWKRSRSAKPCGKPVLYPKPATLESRTSASSSPQRRAVAAEATPRTDGGVSGRRPNGVVESAADGERCRSAAASGDAATVECKTRATRFAGPARPQWAARAAEKLANGDARRVAPLQTGTPAQQQRLQGRESKRADILKPAEALPVRQVGVIRPLVSTVKSAAAPLTPREIQHNYINARLNLMQAEKRNAAAAAAAASQQHGAAGEKCDGVEQRVATGAAKPSALWCQQAWNQHHNTVVFNFSDRKDVPDYIENDGLLFTAGRDRDRDRDRDRAKRILEESGGAGYIILGVENGGLLDDCINESSTDSPTLSCKEEWQLISGPPSPCDVHFEGDNVLINGKSNLRKYPKDKKLRIQFNDTSTTFEYPSEASLLEDDFQNISTSSEQSFPSSPNMVNVPCSSPKVSPLSGTSLASYVPSKLSMGDSFELGVTKSNCVSTSAVASTKQQQQPLTMRNGCVDCGDGSDEGDRDGVQSENLHYLKPASENDNVAWSEESIPDLLF